MYIFFRLLTTNRQINGCFRLLTELRPALYKGTLRKVLCMYIIHSTQSWCPSNARCTRCTDQKVKKKDGQFNLWGIKCTVFVFYIPHTHLNWLSFRTNIFVLTIVTGPVIVRVQVLGMGDPLQVSPEVVIYLLLLTLLLEVPSALRLLTFLGEFSGKQNGGLVTSRRRQRHCSDQSVHKDENMLHKNYLLLI